MLYLTSVTLHVLAALLWLGGMFFLALVGAPVLRLVEPSELRARLFDELGRRFRTVGWAAVGVLLATGALILRARGLLAWPVLGHVAFWRTGFGTALAIKLVAVAILLVLQAIHDFIHGPQASRVPPGSPEALALRRKAALLARLNALVALVVVVAAVRLPRT
jgi:copper resistance protein D